MRVNNKLLSGCSTAAVAAALLLNAAQPVAASDAAYAEERVANAFEPSRYLSVEGAFLLNDSDTVLSFDPDDDKFGQLPPLGAGEDGWQASVEYGSRIDPVWDYRVGASVIDLGTESAQAPGSGFPFPVTAHAATDLRIGYADAEIGYRPDVGSGIDLRLFGGVRGLVASANSSFEAGDKLGEFDDDTWAIGPRIGAGIAVPIVVDRGISFVGSVAGAVLFGQRDTDYSYVAPGVPFPEPSPPITIDQSFSDSVTIWNADVMAGFAIPLTSSASVTLGYKAQAFGNLLQARSDIDQSGDYADDGDADVWLHGPFVKMTISLD